MEQFDHKKQMLIWTMQHIPAFVVNRKIKDKTRGSQHFLHRQQNCKLIQEQGCGTGLKSTIFSSATTIAVSFSTLLLNYKT